MNWLLLRGLTREQRHWADFPSQFQRSLGDDARMHFLDLPGTGTESQRASPYTIGRITDDLRERWLRLKESKPGPWSLFSISLGGMVGMDWVRRYPHDFERIVIINSSAANLNVPYRRLNAQVLPKLLLRVVPATDPVLRERAILSVTTNKSEQDILALAPVWAEYARQSPVKKAVLIAQVTAALRFTVKEALPIPALILSSAKDQLTDPACSQRLAQVLSAPIRVHPTANHDLPLDDGEWVARQIADWLSPGSQVS